MQFDSSQTFKGIQRLPRQASAGGQAVVVIYSLQPSAFERKGECAKGRSML